MPKDDTQVTESKRDYLVLDSKIFILKYVPI